jgi:hypothetical protein
MAQHRLVLPTIVITTTFNDAVFAWDNPPRPRRNVRAGCLLLVGQAESFRLMLCA